VEDSGTKPLSSLAAGGYVCVDLIVYSATSFEKSDDLSSSSLAGVSRSTATPVQTAAAASDRPHASQQKRRRKI